MNSSRAGSCDANTKTPGKLRVCAGHERRGLFVAHVNEPYFLLIFAQGFENAVDPIAGQAKNGVHAPSNKPLNQYVRCVDHRMPPTGIRAAAQISSRTHVCTREFSFVRNASAGKALLKKMCGSDPPREIGHPG